MSELELPEDGMVKPLMLRRDRLTCCNCACNYASEKTEFRLKSIPNPEGRGASDFVREHVFSDGFCQAFTFRISKDNVLENQKKAEGCRQFWPYGFKRDNCSKAYIDGQDCWYEKDSMG